MTTGKKRSLPARLDASPLSHAEYGQLLSEISGLLEQARRASARAINSVLTVTYWEIGRRIVEFEQNGRMRAEYGESLLKKLAADLTQKYGRGFSRTNLQQMRTFYLGWRICQTPSGKLEGRSLVLKPADGKDTLNALQLADRGFVTAGAFPLSWSHYVHLMSVRNIQARAFYESESIAGGWSVRQLDRQIGTQFYERFLGSKNRDDFLARGRGPRREYMMTVEEEVRDPYLLEFLNLKDEYGESDLEEALIRHLEWFLVVVDLKRGKFSHADARQMNLYLNYAKENLKLPDESDPVGIILCGGKNEALVRYATGGIKAKVFASKYLTILPDEETLRQEILRTRRLLEARRKESS
jgi:predicted nuclease of restriction endonuclease-like (RecB) superfamily